MLDKGAVQSSSPVRTSTARSELVESPVCSHRTSASSRIQAWSLTIRL